MIEQASNQTFVPAWAFGHWTAIPPFSGGWDGIKAANVRNCLGVGFQTIEYTNILVLGKHRPVAPILDILGFVRASMEPALLQAPQVNSDVVWLVARC